MRGELDTPATPAKQLARDVTGKRYLEGQPRASSPASQSLEGGASKQGLSNGDNNDEDPANAGTLVMNKEDAQEYQGAYPNDPDPACVGPRAMASRAVRPTTTCGRS
jgi:hypothetical protein